MDIRVFSVTYDEKKQHSCRQCGKLLSEGQYSVMVTIEYGNGAKRHFKLCISPPLECCEGVLDVQCLFNTQAEADAKAKEVRSELAQKSNADCVLLDILVKFHEVH